MPTHGYYQADGGGRDLYMTGVPEKEDNHMKAERMAAMARMASKPKLKGFPAKLVKKERRQQAAKELVQQMRVQNALGWSIDDVETIVREKVLARVKRPEDTLRVSYRLFGNPKGCFRPSDFRNVAERRLGVRMSATQAAELFARYDANGDGDMSFYEFINYFMPHDYPKKPWNVQRGEQQVRVATASSHRLFLPYEKKLPRALSSDHWPLDRYEKVIQDKLLGRCRRPEDQFREIYKIFGCPKVGITAGLFQRVLQKKLGMAISADNARRLFARYDCRGDGSLTLQDFCQHLFPKDYQNSKIWSIKRSKDCQDEAQAHSLGLSTVAMARIIDRETPSRKTTKAKTTRLSPVVVKAPWENRIY